MNLRRIVAASVLGLFALVLAAQTGNPQAGRAIFEAKGGCLQCHTVGNRGGQLGPDLSDIGVFRQPLDLRLALTDPTSGLKALGFRGQVLFASARFPDRFPDADALVLARRLQLLIEERPARMRPSRNRHSMHDGHRAVAYTFNMLASMAVAAFGRHSDLDG